VCTATGCWSEKLEGKYIHEQHHSSAHDGTGECYEDLGEAKRRCEEASDCHGIATQSNICEGKYRVTHGSTATLLHYNAWRDYDLWAYTLDRACLSSGKWNAKPSEYCAGTWGNDWNARTVSTLEDCKEGCMATAECFSINHGSYKGVDNNCVLCTSKATTSNGASGWTTNYEYAGPEIFATRVQCDDFTGGYCPKGETCECHSDCRGNWGPGDANKNDAHCSGGGARLH